MKRRTFLKGLVGLSVVAVTPVMALDWGDNDALPDENKIGNHLGGDYDGDAISYYGRGMTSSILMYDEATYVRYPVTGLESFRFPTKGH